MQTILEEELHFSKLMTFKVNSELLFYFLFIEFIGVTLVNKIIPISGAQSTTQLYTVLYVHHSKSGSLPSTSIAPHLAPPSPPHTPTPGHHTVICVHESSLFHSIQSPTACLGSPNYTLNSCTPTL